MITIISGLGMVFLTLLICVLAFAIAATILFSVAWIIGCGFTCGAAEALKHKGGINITHYGGVK